MRQPPAEGEIDRVTGSGPAGGVPRPRRVVHLISGLARGGAEVNLSRRLPHLPGWDHRVFFVHDGPVRERIEHLGVACRPVRGFWSRTDPGLVPRTIAALDAEQPDLVVAHLWMACILGRLYRRWRGVPLITVLHQDAAFDGPWRRAVTRLVGFPEDRTVAVSQPVAAAARRWFPALEGRVEVIANGIDGEAIRAEVQAHGLDRARLGVGDDEFVLLAIGRFDPVKNFSLLLEAVSDLVKDDSRFRLILVGAGDEEASLRRRAASLGLGDHVLFEVNQPAVPYLALADAFVQPSATEGLSNALLEAMAAGVPVLVTAPPGGHPVVQDSETGLVIGAERGSIAAAVRLLRERAELRNKLGVAGAQHVARHFQVAASARRYDALYREVLERPAGPSAGVVPRGGRG